MPNALNKGAGSEASLPLTLRVRRRALKLLFPQVSVKNQKQAARVGQPVESLLLAVPVHQRFEFIQHLFGICLIFAAREEVGFQLRLRA